MKDFDLLQDLIQLVDVFLDGGGVALRLVQGGAGIDQPVAQAAPRGADGLQAPREAAIPA